MSPDQRSDRAAQARTTCTDCDETLPPGRLIRCDDCTEAARVAIGEADGKTVRPSDIAAIRARGE